MILPSLVFPGFNHRYLREVDCSRQNPLQQTRVLVAGTYKAGGPGQAGRLVGAVDVPALIADIFEAVTNKTHIHPQSSIINRENIQS